jgi:hypothetical protein
LIKVTKFLGAIIYLLLPEIRASFGVRLVIGVEVSLFLRCYRSKVSSLACSNRGEDNRADYSRASIQTINLRTAFL